MKIEQKPIFQPITIVLETAEEAEQLWELITTSEEVTGAGTYALSKRLSDWFSTNAQLGGK